MKDRFDHTTALLASAFGALLLDASAKAHALAGLDPKTAKELAVLSRILEKRLVDVRKVLAGVTPEKASAIASAALAPHNLS